MNIGEGVTYLNHASIGPLPKITLEIITKTYNDQSQLGEGSINIDEMLELWNTFRENVATLLHGSKDGVTVTSNTASGLHIVADGLHKRYQEGKNIVITEMEFSTNSYCWQKVTNRYGMDLKIIPTRNNRLLFEDWENIINDQTVLASLSHVQFSNGFRTDLAEISKLAHDHNALVLVDAIQSLGVVPFDIEKSGVDFVSTGGYKWLLGPYNIGFLYSKPEHLELLDTVLVGWFSSKEFYNMSHNPFNPWDDARRFQQSPMANINAFNASVEVILEWDVNKTYDHVIGLNDYLIKKISDTDLTLSSSLVTGTRSGIIKLNTHVDALKLVNYLKKKKTIIAFRDGGIRISPHRHNTKDDIDILIDHILKYKEE